MPSKRIIRFTLQWLVFLLINQISCFALVSKTTATPSSPTFPSLQTNLQPQARSQKSRHLQILESQNSYRHYCPSCHRPPTQCLCPHLPSEKIKLDTQVLVLQHPVEFRRKTISTVPLLKLVLDRCRVLVGRSFDGEALEEIIHGAMVKEGRIPLLLFPGKDAVTLENYDALNQIRKRHHSNTKGSTNPENMQQQQNRQENECKFLLIIVDGTWTQAKAMVRNSPILLDQSKCQRVQFTSTSQRSIYDSIRKQPDSHCLSTLESCERTLKLLEGRQKQQRNDDDNDDRRRSTSNMELASKHLLGALNAMILKQMEYERVSLEQHPESIRNVEKLREKKERQELILANGGEVDTGNVAL